MSFLDPFSSLVPLAVNPSNAFIQSQIRQYETELFTGIFHVTGNLPVIILFFQGKITSLYFFENGVWTTEDKLRWSGKIPVNSGELRIISMPVDGLRIARLLLESNFAESKTIPPMPADRVKEYISQWNRNGRAGLVTLKQNGSSALLLVPAQDAFGNEAVLFDSYQAQTGSNALNQVKSWGGRYCQVALCVYEPRSEAWREYSLRVSFGAFLQSVLMRYEELAGRSLVADLDEQVNEETRSWGFAMSIHRHTFSNRHYFEGPEKAGSAYGMIFSLIGDQIGAVVGDKMAATIQKEAILQLDLDPRMLVQEYVFSRIKA